MEPSVVSARRRKVIYGLAPVCLSSVFALGMIAPNEWFPRSVVTSTIENVPNLTTSVAAKTEEEAPPAVESVSDSKLEVELVVISPTGFEPNVIRRNSGRVLLVVVNDSNRPLITLRAEAANGSVIRQIQMPRTKRRWELPVNLRRGRFQIVDTERPDNVLNIEITE